MSQQKVDLFAAGLSEAEQHDLEKMIGDFHRHRSEDSPTGDREPMQTQLDSINRKLADLSEMVLNLDRRMTSLAEVIRLSHQKSELLNQRLDAVIAALKKGHLR